MGIRKKEAAGAAGIAEAPVLTAAPPRFFAAPRAADDAWIQISQIALAHKSCRFADARQLTERLLATYPGSAGVLIRQAEIPDGRFARIRVPAYGEDELVVAVSEGVVLLMEGMERTGRGVLGAWVARTVSELSGEKGSEGASAS